MFKCREVQKKRNIKRYILFIILTSRVIFYKSLIQKKKPLLKEQHVQQTRRLCFFIPVLIFFFFIDDFSFILAFVCSKVILFLAWVEDCCLLFCVFCLCIFWFLWKYSMCLLHLPSGFSIRKEINKKYSNNTIYWIMCSIHLDNPISLWWWSCHWI